jgi:hypothetical protein
VVVVVPVAAGWEERAWSRPSFFLVVFLDFKNEIYVTLRG